MTQARCLDCRVDGREVVPRKTRFGKQGLVGVTKIPHPDEHFVLTSLDGFHNVPHCEAELPREAYGPSSGSEKS